MQPRRFLALSLETIMPIRSADKWRLYLPVGPACAATSTADEELVWYAHDPGQNNATAMTAADAASLVDYLQQMTSDGYTITTWNGMGFDWPALAKQSRRVEECRQLALNHVDMMYQVLCTKGFCLKDESAAAGMGIRLKTGEEYDNDKPERWAKNHPKLILVRCNFGADLILKVSTEAQRTGRLKWISRNGGRNGMSLKDGWKTVREARVLPEPDTSRFHDPIPRILFDDWLCE